MPGNGKGLADVLQGLTASVPAYAQLLLVLAALLGMFLTGYAMTRLYRAVNDGDGTAVNWIFAIVIGSAMTILSIVLGSLSFYFAD